MITYFRDYDSRRHCFKEQDSRSDYFKAQNLDEARKEVRIQLACENVTSVRMFYSAGRKGEKSVVFYKGVGPQP